MDELNRLADDYEWFLQAVATGVLKRKTDLADREATFQPRGQYLFEVEQGSGEWLQVGNEYAIRANGLPAYYREQIIATVQQRLARMGPHQMLLLAALMRHYQLRVYQPRLEVDETGAELPSPSLPNITAKRLHDEWLRRAAAAEPALAQAEDRALELLAQWSEAVPGSAADAYPWEVQQSVDKRVLRPEYLAGEAACAALLGGAQGAPAMPSAAPAGAGVPLFKVYVNRMQQGPYTVAELAQRIARGEVTAQTKVWNMRWVPHVDQWQGAATLPELAPLFAQAIPDPVDDIPDPE
jgi:hypothetical protein